MIGHLVESKEARLDQSTIAPDVALSVEGGASYVDPGRSRFAALRQQKEPQGLHTGPTRYLGGAQASFPARLPQSECLASRMERAASNFAFVQGASFHDPSKGSPTACQKRGCGPLLDQLAQRARELKLADKAVTASVDATGLEDHHASPHFLKRRGRRTHRYQPWLKLTLVGDHRSHLLLGAVTSRGPSNDSPSLRPAVQQACSRVQIDQLLGDGAFDSEPHHRFCRETLRISRTIFPINTRGHPQTVRGHYRRQLAKRFPQKLYQQRWQIESIVSRYKRRLGCVLTARCRENQDYEALWRTIAYNCLLIALDQGFYKAH